MFRINATSLPAHNPESQNVKTFPEGAYIKKKFGQEILWCERQHGGFHVSKEELEAYRLLGDYSLDNILDLLDSENDGLEATADFFQVVKKAERLHSSNRSPAQAAIVAFIDKYSNIPEWVDTEQLRRGQEVFLAYTPAASLSLYYRSLVAGFSIPKIAAVIQATAYLSPPARPDQSLQRILDTGELNAACLGLGLNSLLPKGLGWKTAIYVRVLHAKVRRSLLHRKGVHAWDIKQYGLPINQEDLSATLLAFSTNVLDGIDIIAGVQVPHQERLDYLALWRYIGWLLGVETEGDRRPSTLPSMRDMPPLDPCGPGRNSLPDPCKHSTCLLDSFIDHLLQPDESSVTISRHLLQITDRKPPSLRMTEIPCEFYENDLFYFRCLQFRKLMGDPLADALAIPVHPIKWKRILQNIKSTMFLTMFRCYTLASMWVPFIRRRAIQLHSIGMRRFHDEWTKTHKTKLAMALKKGDKASCVKDESFERQANSENTVQPMSSTVCPFAMIAKPE